MQSKRLGHKKVNSKFRSEFTNMEKGARIRKVKKDMHKKYFFFFLLKKYFLHKNVFAQPLSSIKGNIMPG
jgi:hypothetical protein